MASALILFAWAWVLTEAGSLAMLTIGAQVAGNRLLMRLGQLAHRQKLYAVEHMWPLTRLRSAAGRGETWTCTLILAPLIVLKSLGCLVFGVVFVFWLPLASLVVPSVVAVHDPDDQALSAWVRKVATLQVTSDAIAAALGFAVVLSGALNGSVNTDLIAENGTLLLAGSAASLAFAIAAARLEAMGVVTRGI